MKTQTILTHVTLAALGVAATTACVAPSGSDVVGQSTQGISVGAVYNFGTLAHETSSSSGYPP